MNTVYSVTQINSYIRRMFDADILLGRVSVEGEVSNCKYHQNSGHIYFTLKDEGAALQCMMFRNSVRAGLAFKMAEGDKVTVTGRIGVYEKNGTYRLIASKIEKQGTGNLYERFLKLKEELEKAGLFAPEHKKKIPALCRRLGVVTAPDAAAVRDIINVAKRRNPGIEIFVYPAIVQGEGASKSICGGLKKLDRMELDVIIAGRGGGSLEDLWAFNEEATARAIFACETPVISAVGHETDFTIADFTADLRAPTPSAAAELAVGDIYEMIQTVDDLETRLNRKMKDAIAYDRRVLEDFGKRIRLLGPENVIKNKKTALAAAGSRLNDLIFLIMERARHALETETKKLDAYSPLKKLSGGYAYLAKDDGRALINTDDVKTGEEFTAYLRDGEIRAAVRTITRRENKWES